MFEIRNGRLHHAGGEPVPFVPTPNQGGAIAPELIVLHDTAGQSAASAIDWLKNPETRVSAHFVVGPDGWVTQMVLTDKAAWHAGVSSWNGRAQGNSVNAFAVGIEIVNPGRLDADGKAWFGKVYPDSEPRTTVEHGAGRWVGYTPQAIAAVTGIAKACARAYPAIAEPERITTHWYIRNEAIARGWKAQRKVDTNPLFPLNEVRAAVFGGHEPQIEEAIEMPQFLRPVDMRPTPPVPAPPPAVASSPPPPEKAPMLSTAAKSKSLWAIVVAAAFKGVEMATTWLQDLWDVVLWGVGALPEITSEVRTTLTSSEEVATWFRIDWATVSLAVAGAVLVVVFLRHLNDKRALEVAKAAQQAPTA